MKNLIAKKNLIQQKVKYMKRKIKRIQAVCIYMMLLLLLLLPQTAMAKNTEKSKTTFPVQVIHKTGDDKENFVIVIMGDGYTAGQQDQFLEDATQKARGMLTWSPYREYSDRINIYAVQAVSNEPGIGVYGGKSPDTYFHVKVYGKAAGFTNGGDERAKALRTELEENYLDEGANVGTIHILCNDTGSYGASVNPLFSFSTNSEDNSDGMVMAHETAHSIGGLGDEYERYTNKPNMSDTTDPEKIKWSKMLGFRGIGITNAGTDAAFAPSRECMMRWLGQPFCEVCKMELARKLNNTDYVSKPAALYISDPEVSIPHNKTATLDRDSEKYRITESNVTKANDHDLEFRTVVQNMVNKEQHLKMSFRIIGADGITVKYSAEKEFTIPALTNSYDPDAARESLSVVLNDVYGLTNGDRLDGKIVDWCISRQLWWGHRIPAYYCDDCGEISVSATPLTVCPKCGKPVRQDEDTLDTWFSSALWPFSTLGWPEETEDLKYFYPTNTLVTGYDIITFWVSRMIFSGLTYTDKAPFDTVLIHGLVRDAQGRKMSKSLGNGIDPLEIIDQYGADALRLTLVVGSTPGNDMRFSDEKVKASRNFANKLWNAARFVMMNLPEDFRPGLPASLTMADKWVLSQLNTLVKNVTENLDKFELGLAAQKVQDFIWDVYCDWYIEIAKLRLNSEDAAEADSARQILVSVLVQALKLLHPFMPFITEEIYTALPGASETLMLEKWPGYEPQMNYAEEEAGFEKVMDLIKAVRTLRADMGVHPAKRTSLIIETADKTPFEDGAAYLAKFAFANEVSFTEKYTGDTKGVAQVVTHAARAFIPMLELIDREKEQARLAKEKAQCEKEIASMAAKLSNEGFVNKAPAHIVEDMRQKHAAAAEKLAKIEESIRNLG